MSIKSSGKTFGPPSIGKPDPLKTRPLKTQNTTQLLCDITHYFAITEFQNITFNLHLQNFLPSISLETGSRIISPKNSTAVCFTSIPRVPSNTFV